jgi:hypothetical protein
MYAYHDNRSDIPCRSFTHADQCVLCTSNLRVNMQTFAYIHVYKWHGHVHWAGRIRPWITTYRHHWGRHQQAVYNGVCVCVCVWMHISVLVLCACACMRLRGCVKPYAHDCDCLYTPQYAALWVWLCPRLRKWYKSLCMGAQKHLVYIYIYAHVYSPTSNTLDISIRACPYASGMYVFMYVLHIYTYQTCSNRIKHAQTAFMAFRT